MKNFLQRFWPTLFLAAIFILMFYKVFFLGQVFYDGDNFHLNIPEKYFYVQQILRGRLPLWNPYIFLGTPYLADINLGVLNFTNVVYFFFSVPRALTILTIFDLFVLSIGTYLFLRFLKLSKTAAVFGGVIMSLGGIPFVLLGNMTMLNSIVYIPFLFLILFKFCRERILKWLLLLIGVQFLQLIAGHPQSTYYTMFFIVVYLLLISQFTFWKRILIIMTYGIFSMLLASVQYVPFVEYVLHANRPETSIGYAGWGGLSLPLLSTFIFPTFYGSHTNGSWWGPQQVLVGFIGIPTLVLLYVAIRFASFKNKWFYVGGLILSFILAFGVNTPLFYLFYYVVPGWRLFRSPAGILVFYTFFAAILAAFGLEYLKNHPEKFKILGKWITGVGLVCLAISIAIYLYANKQGFWKEVFGNLQKHLHIHIISSIIFYDEVKIQQMFQGITWNIVFVSVSLLLTGIILWLFAKKQYQAFLFLLVTISGFLAVNPKVILLAPHSYYDAGKAIPAVLQPAKEGQYRILSVPVDFHTNRKYLAPADFFYKEGQTNLGIYQYDNNIERGLYQAGGYVSLVPGSFASFINGEKTSVTNIDFSNINQEQLNLSSIRYVLSYEPLKLYQDIPLQLVSKQNNQYIYENKSALSRVYILENKQEKVQWIKNTSSEIDLQTQTTKASHLILTDWYYPGWKALVNGKGVVIVPYLSTFQEIAIPKGKSSIEFVYDPISVKIGMVISSLAVVFWLGLFITKRKTNI